MKLSLQIIIKASARECSFRQLSTVRKLERRLAKKTVSGYNNPTRCLSVLSHVIPPQTSQCSKVSRAST